MANNNINIDIDFNVKQALSEIDKLKNQFKTLNKNIKSNDIKEFDTNLKKVNTTSESLVGSLGKLTAIVGVGALFSEGIKSVADFEESISKLGAISKASSEDLEKMKQKSLELGATTRYTSSQVAEAMNYEAMAGMKANQILSATKPILDLASVGQMDLARASDIATDTMSAFGMKADEVGKITDVMAVTITSSNTDVEQLGEAFKNVAPVAHNLGLNIEQTSAMLGVLADSGKKGGEAGTHLKIILQRLASQTKEVQKGFKAIGVSAYDSNGKLKPMTETLKKIKSKLDGLNDKDRNNILKNLFGEEAISSANIILNNLDKMDSKLKKITNSAGESSKMAKEMNDNLKGDWNNLKSALDGLAQAIGEDLLPSLRSFTKDLTDTVRGVTSFYKENKVLVETVTEVGLALIGVNKIMKFGALFGGNPITSLRNLKTELKLIITTIIELKGALFSLIATNPLLIGLTVAITGVVYALNELQESVDKLNKTADTVTTATKNVNGMIEELYSKHLNKATQQLELTNDELKKYKKNTDDLIVATKKQLEEVKKNSDGSTQYKNSIAQLETKLKLLKDTQKGLNNAKIVEDTKKVTKEVEKQSVAVEELTSKQKSYIKSLDSQLAKEETKHQTIDEWYKYQLKRLDDMLKGTDEYLSAKNKLDKIYRIKQKDLQDKQKKEADKLREEELKKLKDIQDKKLKTLKSSYTKRINEHTNTILKLQDKEKSLADKIVQINKDLQNKLKNIEQNRINDIEAIDSKIHSIQVSKLSDYKQYLDKKKQSDILYNKTKLALKNGELEQVKKYMSQYESLVGGLANTEIKEGHRVLVSKKKSNADSIAGLKKLETLTNSYYDKQKAKEIEAHNQKISQLKAELEATKAQIQLEVQRLNLEKQMIEILTGKKVDIDTSSALNSIENLDKQIKSLDNQIKPKKVINLDGTSAINTINKVKKTYGDLTLNDKTITINADTTPADFGIKQLIISQKNNHINIKVNPEYTKAENDIKKAINKFENNPVKTPLEVDTRKAESDVVKLKNSTQKPVEFGVGIDDKIAKSKIKELKNPFTKELTISIEASKALSVINTLKQSTSSVHTVYVKEVKQKAIGGLIEPIKLATGGKAEFERKNGRISGYDPSDSDDVPAMLTRGEFVVKREAVKHYGDDFLYKINNKNLPKYATGGLVEQGTPQKLITDLQSDLSNETSSDSEINLDTSKLDDYLEKLNELLQTLKLGGSNKFVGEIQKDIKNINNVENKITKDEDKYTKDEDKLNNYKDTIKGKTLTESEYNSYISKTKSLNNVIDKDKNLLEDIDTKQVSKLEDELQKTVNKIDFYLKKVDITKDKIYSKLSNLNIDRDNFPELDSNLDLTRLEKFYNSLTNLNMLDESEIEYKFNELVKNYVGAYQNTYYSSFSNNEAFRNTHKVTAPTGREFLESINISDKSLAQKYDNILKYKVSPSSFGNQTIDLGDDIISKTQADYLKKYLPKFQNGGAINGVEGGKLSGYGGGDRNLALLEDGEFIVKKEAVSHFGTDFLHNVNNIKLPKFNTGGMVDFNNLPKFNTGGEVGTNSGNTTNINFTMPSGNSYNLMSSEDVANALGQEFRSL